MIPARGIRLGAAILIGAWVCSFGAAARAEPNDSSRAQTLFFEGREALQRKDYALACSKFRQSLEIESRSSTHLNLAQCEESQGHLVAALGFWRTGAAALETSDDRLPIARAHIQDLEQRIARLKLVARRPLSEFARISIDGRQVPRADAEAGIALDPGRHEVVVQSPGGTPWRDSVVLEPGARREMAIGEQEPKDHAESSTVPIAIAPAAETPEERGSSGRRSVAYAAGGLGVAGMITAAITGGILLSKNSTIQDNCPGKQCNPTGRDAIESTHSLFTINAIGWGVGVAGLGVATWLLLTGNERRSAPGAALAPTVIPGGAALSVDGRF